MGFRLAPRAGIFAAMTIDDPLTIGPVPADQTENALRLVFQRVAPGQLDGLVPLYVRSIESGEVAQSSLIGAFRAGVLVGAMIAHPQSGRTALVWPARIAPGEPSSTALQLMAASDAYLRQHKVRLGNAMMDGVTRADDVFLRSVDYRPLTSLYYMAVLAADFPESPPKGPFAFEPYALDQRPRMMGVLAATYEGSRDCPVLDGLRSMDDTIDGYQGTGVFSPDRWFFVRHEGCDVGCLLLADHPQDNQLELVYMGLVPSVRGHGWGVQVARYAQWRTRQDQRARLVVAVDAANAPAVAMYSKAGYFTWQQRRVYLRIFPEMP
jgi:ribosomal protein S18 acetylase RimI-like enzyme